MNDMETVAVLKEASDYCEKLYSGMNTMVENIRNRNLIDLEIYFKNILEGFNWVIEVSIYCSELSNKKIEIIHIEEKLNRYINGFNNLDLLYVQDVVEYELMPQVEVFYEIIYKTLNSLNSN